MNKVINVLSVLVLIGGVIASVRLVGMNQDIRRSAAPDGIALCHRTGSEDKGVTIHVNENAVAAHLDHGDQVGECANTSENNNTADSDSASENQTQSQSENNTQNENQGKSQSNTNIQTEQSNPTTQTSQPSNQTAEQTQTQETTQQTSNSQNQTQQLITSNNQTNENNNNQTIQQSESVSNQGVITTPTPIPNRLLISARAQGVGVGTIVIPATLDFYQNGKKVITRNVTLAFNRTNGAFEASINGIEAGNYQLVLHTNAHLARVFDISINRGLSTWNFTATTLIAGDFTGDNKITPEDVSLFMTALTDAQVPVQEQNKRFDINQDGVIDSKDLSILLGNYNKLIIEGEKI